MRKPFILLVALAACNEEIQPHPLAASSLTDADAIIEGTGTAVVSAGDVNADGYDDILIGDSGEKEACLLLGPVSGVRPVSHPLNKPDARFIGDGSSWLFGASVAGLGDVNGDGYDDILVSGNGYDNWDRAYLVLGPTTGLSMLFCGEAALTSEPYYDYPIVAYAGDVDLDGFDDVLIGYPDADINAFDDSGFAFVLPSPLEGNVPLGRSGMQYIGNEHNDHAGTALSAGGDINGDGFDDFMIGASGHGGHIYLFLGALDMFGRWF